MAKLPPDDAPHPGFSPAELEQLRQAFEHSRSRYKKAQQIAAPAIFEEWMGVEPAWLTSTEAGAPTEWRLALISWVDQHVLAPLRDAFCSPLVTTANGTLGPAQDAPPIASAQSILSLPDLCALGWPSGKVLLTRARFSDDPTALDKISLLVELTDAAQRECIVSPDTSAQRQGALVQLVADDVASQECLLTPAAPDAVLACRQASHYSLRYRIL